MKKSGISLVALVITIIVLIIITGAIILTTINNGIFDKADYAVNKQQIEETRDYLQSCVLNTRLETMNMSIEKEEFQTKLKGKIQEKDKKVELEYNDLDGKIHIIFHIGKRELEFTLDENYILRYIDEDAGYQKVVAENSSDWLIEENEDGTYTIIGFSDEKIKTPNFNNIVIPNIIIGENGEELIVSKVNMESLNEAWGNGEFYEMEEFNDIDLESIFKLTGTLKISDGIVLENIFPSFENVTNEITRLEIGNDCEINCYICNTESLKDIIIGNNSKAAEYGIFSYNYNLENVTIGSGCEIGSDAFADCKGIKKIKIGNGCEIGSGAFSFYGGEIDIVEIGKDCNIGSGAFGSLCKDVKIGDECILKEYAFSGGGYKLTLGNKCAVGDLALSSFGCDEMETLIIPGGTTFTGTANFAGCAFKNVVIEEGVDTLTHEMFTDSGIKTITIPSTIKNVGSDILYDNRGLERVIVGSEEVKQLLINNGGVDENLIEVKQ